MAYARGDEIPGTQGPPRTATTGLWTLEGPETQPADLDAQAAVLLQELTPNLDVWRLLADRFEIDLFCGWFMADMNEGLRISPDTLMSLAARCIVLDVDIYRVGRAHDADA